MLRQRAWLPCLRPHFSWLEIVCTFSILALQNLFCKGVNLAIIIQQFEKNKAKINPVRTLTVLRGKKSISFIYRYVNFPFLFYSVRSLPNAGIFPRAQQLFPAFQCHHLLLTTTALTSTGSPNFCFCTFAPEPFLQQWEKEPEAPTQPTLLENQISDKKPKSFVLGHKYENWLVQIFLSLLELQPWVTLCF